MRAIIRLLFCISAALVLVARCEEENVEEQPADDDIPEMSEEEMDPEDEGSTGDEPLDPKVLEDLHKKIDKNGDGKISIAEVLDFSVHRRKDMALKTINDHLEMLDEDKDGKVNLKELTGDLGSEETNGGEPLSELDKKRDQEMRDLEEAKFKAADKNGDGFLDNTELPHAVYPEISPDMLRIVAGHTLKTKDTNGDGALDLTEFWYDQTAGSRIEDFTAEDKQEMEKEFKLLDLDGDGKLNAKEVERWESGEYHTAVAFNELFDKADANKDSHLSLSELNDHHTAMQEMDAYSHFNEWAQRHDEM